MPGNVLNVLQAFTHLVLKNSAAMGTISFIVQMGKLKPREIG